jgi:hypothetical protein
MQGQPKHKSTRAKVIDFDGVDLFEIVAKQQVETMTQFLEYRKLHRMCPADRVRVRVV